MEEGYRIPAAEEFVQGFKFEKACATRMVMIDFGKPPVKDETPFTRHWVESEVWWDCKPDEFITQEYEGHKVLLKGSTVNFFKPFDVESFIKQGLVRVKTDGNSNHIIREI